MLVVQPALSKILFLQTSALRVEICWLACDESKHWRYSVTASQPRVREDTYNCVTIATQLIYAGTIHPLHTLTLWTSSEQIWSFLFQQYTNLVIYTFCYSCLSISCSYQNNAGCDDIWFVI